jgi:hypothetical protein
MTSYDVTIYSHDGSCDENGDMNGVKHEFEHTSKTIFDLLDQVKAFILSSNISDHDLAIEIEQNLMK